MSHFDLYSDQTKALIKLWSDLRPDSSFDARHFLVDVLHDLEESSLRNYEKAFKKSKDYETKVQDTLSGSAGYAAEIIEHRLRETIEGHLEVQRASPGKMREDIATEMTEQFLMLALECFIAGSAAGKFKLLPREVDLALADRQRKVLDDNNLNAQIERKIEAEHLRSLAESLWDEFPRFPTNKSEAARRVRKELEKAREKELEKDPEEDFKKIPSLRTIKRKIYSE